MTEALRQVVEEIEKLPEAEQDSMASCLEDELNRRWDELLDSPESVRMLDRLAGGALNDARAGRVKECGIAQG